MASKWEDHGLAFDRGDGHCQYQSHSLRRHKTLCAKAGIRAINHHALRHTAATIMLESGVHAKDVSEILGHASVQATLDIYSHVWEGLQRSAVDAVSGALFGALTVVEDDNMSHETPRKTS